MKRLANVLALLGAGLDDAADAGNLHRLGDFYRVCFFFKNERLIASSQSS
jgi:hypothetical protein